MLGVHRSFGAKNTPQDDKRGSRFLAAPRMTWANWACRLLLSFSFLRVKIPTSGKSGRKWGTRLIHVWDAYPSARTAFPSGPGGTEQRAQNSTLMLVETSMR